MKFYNREKELKTLDQLYKQAGQSGRMTVLIGRRRVGKTLLALQFSKSHKHLYLFVSKKSESLLCMEYQEEIRKKFDIPDFAETHTFKGIFALLITNNLPLVFTIFYPCNAWLMTWPTTSRTSNMNT